MRNQDVRFQASEDDRFLSIESAGPFGEMIEESWRRSLEHGLRDLDRPQYDPIDSSGLHQLCEQNLQLMRFAAPVMETLYQQIIDTDSMVLLTDSEGIILHSLGDDDFLQRAARVALRPGVVWSEQSKGTNAIGTALVEDKPVLVHGGQHFLKENKFLTCSATPIHDPAGRAIGVLDVSGDYRSSHKHTIALVRMCASMIENGLFKRAYSDQLQIAFHTRVEFIGTLAEGIVSFGTDGRVLSANRSACCQLGQGLSALRMHTVASLFRVTYSQLMDDSRRAVVPPVQLTLSSGLKIHGIPTSKPSIGRELSVVTDPRRESAVPLTAAGGDRPQRQIDFDVLDTGDERMHQVIERLRRVASSDISIVIDGETGSGKEWLAQAIHQASPRRGRPYVAINCASIPEGLIEAELYGYEEGAFTGARRRGSPGKIVQANGGTLFLDEIGDMPLPLQGRLLRVLQERIVTPLGSGKAISVDIKVVCATHRRLKDLIAEGRFREDLYYRLNGLLVKLPPVRERSDLRALVLNILRVETGEENGYSLADDVWPLFERHYWPGNLRQMANVLRTAVAIAGCERIISRLHLPDDFLDDLREMDAIPVGPSLVSQGSLEDLELSAVRLAVERAGGNISVAARQLGISRNTLYRKLKQIA